MRNLFQGTCPACGREIEIVHHRLNIPHFSDILLVSIVCECGYRHIDTIILGEGEPSRWTMQVAGGGDLATRVVRSTTGTIEIPELEMKVEPGTACEGFVSNVEGVLDRFENAVMSFLSWTEDDSEREHAASIRERIARARAGGMPFTLIVEDPAGNSAIISKKAVRTPLEEADT
ncbi:zn finger containing protein [hydrocarbon metagenome]|uniref:Zn finger containing protein n=1 Tax=hydrocarbon metagenome TaxID=938273 RepID=A0A0W8FIB6_9ZZZZ|nr:ZPR1 zinc finger domain-containing protein [Methanomicrobiaceae archaeon]